MRERKRATYVPNGCNQRLKQKEVIRESGTGFKESVSVCMCACVWLGLHVFGFVFVYVWVNMLYINKHGPLLLNWYRTALTTASLEGLIPLQGSQC